MGLFFRTWVCSIFFKIFLLDIVPLNDAKFITLLQIEESRSSLKNRMLICWIIKMI